MRKVMKTNKKRSYNLFILFKLTKCSVKIPEVQELLSAYKELIGAKKE